MTLVNQCLQAQKVAYGLWPSPQPDPTYLTNIYLRPNGLRYWQGGGYEQGSGAGKLEASKILENGDESHLSSAH